MHRTEPYPIEIREIAIRLLKEGKKAHQIALLLGVSTASISRWRRLESLTPLPRGGSKPRDIGVDILEYVKNHPGKTIAQLAEGLPIKRTAILQRLHKAQYTFKKKVTPTKKVTP